MKTGDPFKKLEQQLIHKPGGFLGMQSFIQGGAIEGANIFFSGAYKVIITMKVEDIKAAGAYLAEANGRIEFA